MTTPSHLIMTLALHRRMRAKPIPRTAVGMGAIAPDIALIILMSLGTFWFSVQYPWTLAEGHRYAMDAAYYTNPAWVIAYNLLHAPLVLGLLLILTWRARWSQAGWARWVFWFTSAASLHTIIDIGTHHTDGPLLLFPFNWHLRFHSPLSYWNPQYYGFWVLSFELVLDLGLLIYLWRTRHVTRRTHDSYEGPGKGNDHA